MFNRARALIFGACSAVCALSPLAFAQAPRINSDECILDRCGDRKPPAAGAPSPSGGANQRGSDRPYGRDAPPAADRNDRRGGGGERYGSPPGRFDFYVLSLSWSPSYCASDAGRRSREQCAPGANNSFVVHGLWPQFERGFPSYCDDRNPPRAALDSVRGVFPEEGLARYQWRKHGSCSGLPPSAYYDLVRQVRALVVIPAELRRPDGPLRKDPAEIQRAFLASNTGLREGMISVTCTRGQLEEVRICLGKDGKAFQSCPELARSSCRASNVSVPAPR